MDDADFRRWLTRRSWGLMVRYCRAVCWLLPLAIAAKDLPLLLASDPAQAARVPGLLAWQLAIGTVVAGIVVADRWLPALRESEPALYLACALYMVGITWAGVTGVRDGGTGLALYAASATFLAAVVATPRPVRGPMYVASGALLALAAWDRYGTVQRAVAFLVNPFCVVLLCLWLERFTFTRDRDLYRQTRRAEAERERADAVLAEAMPASVAEELKRDGRVRARKHENLGVLFADIAGFTRLATRLPPDALVLVLDEIFSAFDRQVARHGLEKIKTIGDAYMVVSHGGGQALCGLALDLRAALERYNQENGTELSMRIGVHAGPAVAGVVGVRRYQYDVWGDTVNVASRLESSGRAGAIQVSEVVVRQAGDGFAFSARGLVELEGRGRMLTYWLHGVAQPQPVAWPEAA